MVTQAGHDRALPTQGPTRVAYLVNVYPAVSHSFIRREILALERQGIEVQRIALRGWDDALVDPEDIRERERTRVVLRDGVLALLAAVVATAVARPLRLPRWPAPGDVRWRRDRIARCSTTGPTSPRPASSRVG